MTETAAHVARHRSPRARGRRSRLVRGLSLGLAVALALTLLAGAYVAWQASRARSELRAGAGLLSVLNRQLHDRDNDGAARTLADLQGHTAAARSDTSGLVWSAVARLPVIGDDVSAVRSLAAAADDLAGKGVPGLVAAARALAPGALRPVGGRIDVAPLTRASDAVIAGDAAVRSAAAAVRALDRPGLLAIVRESVQAMATKLDDAATATGGAARAIRLLPPMLGADGPRTYLLVFQNLAETRATGGIWGAWATVRADHGQVSIVKQGSAADINDRAGDVAVPPALRNLYGERMGHFFQDVNLTPDFPTAAALGAAMYTKAFGAAIDGVVAVDPVALSYLLTGSSGVPLPGGAELTSGNAVQLLLSDVYRSVPDPKQQDVVFAVAARGVFAALTGDSSAGAVDGLRRAAGEGRVLVWSAHAGEQASLGVMRLGGSLEGAAASDVGVYLNDGTGAKMDYYLTESVRLEPLKCAGGHAAAARLTLTLRSNAPESGLPPYVTGGGAYGVPVGTVRTNVLVVAPRGAGISGASIDGVHTAIGSGIEHGRQVGVIRLDVAPAQQRVITVELAGLGELQGVQVGPVVETITPRYVTCEK